MLVFEACVIAYYLFIYSSLYSNCNLVQENGYIHVMRSGKCVSKGDGDGCAVKETKTAAEVDILTTIRAVRKCVLTNMSFSSLAASIPLQS